MIILYTFFILFFNIILTSAKIVDFRDIQIETVIKHLGYELEVYKVVTNDSYTLFLHRLKSHRFRNYTSRPPVLLMHGLAGSSIDWIITKQQSLGIMLFKKGYDVWLGNNRNSMFASLNVSDTTLALKHLEKLDYSWHEMGTYDLPKIIDKVLEVTKYKKLYYVGYSQGATEFFVLTSLFPEYNDKIHLMISLAPAVYTGNIDIIPRLIAKTITYPLMLITNNFGHFKFVWTTSILTIFETFCIATKMNILQTMCVLIAYTVVGREAMYEPVTRYLLYGTQSSSTKQFLHYSQLACKPNRFSLYDYGTHLNEQFYKSKIPPEYPVEKITASVYIFHGTDDLFVTPASAKLLQSRLKNCVGIYAVDKFKHIDFLFGKRKVQLYRKVEEVLQSFKNLD